MDFHMLIVIACVFLASLFSLLFINKFFRGKTFEEVAAEKKLLAEKLYGSSRTKRQPRKVPSKKEIKKEKKQKQKESAANKEADVDSHNDSDAPSDTQSMESSPSHKKPHVEFSEPEIIADDDNTGNNVRRSSSAGEKGKTGKRKVSNSKPPGSGILVNKSEPVFVKDTPVVETLNNFEAKQPKDVLELKKQPKEESVEKKEKEKEKSNTKDAKKSSKTTKKDQKEPEKVVMESQSSGIEEIPAVKEVKRTEEKAAKSHDSPKNQNKQKKEKKKVEQASSILDKLDGSDVIGVNCLMTLFSRAELNRSEIQMLIDYLLNKQQDTLANHSEWSDDIVQKLKKQLAEKDKALQEEQEASAGIQAKLRDLRTEINAERIQFNATVKAYTEDIQAKKMEIHNLTQEIQNLTEKLNLERQQFQAKLRHEKQAGSQELLAQIQQLNERNNLLQNEIVQKNTIINELQMIANASHQAVEETKAKLNEIIQQQGGEIHALQQNIAEAEKTIARQQYDLELAKMVEKDKESSKVEIRNLQNALDSTQAELNLARNEVNDSKKNIEILTAQIEDLKNQLTSELELAENQVNDSKKNVEILTAQIEELNKQITSVNDKCQEQTKESNELRIALVNYEAKIAAKDEKIAEYEITLKTLTNKEDELMKQISEQKEKNNQHQPDTSTSSSKDEQRIRELFQRLYPEATKSTAGSALSLSFDQWIEQVVTTHIKQNVQQQQQQRNLQKEQISNSKIEENNSSESNKKTSSHNSNHQTSTQSSTNHNHHNSSEETSDKSNSKDNSNSSSSNKDASTPNLILQNAQLRAHIEELTAIVTRTENMLTNLETQAREQDAYWRSVVQTQQEEINSLKNSNGQAI